MRNALREESAKRDWYAGIPMPLDNEALVIEPSYPFADMLKADAPTVAPEDVGLTLRSQFWSSHRMADILIIEEQGRISYGIKTGIHHFKFDVGTMGCADAWGIEQESAALSTLAGLLPHHAFKRYLLTGMFLESSERSGVTYCFRRLRPTVAISVVTGESRILCALCLHPIAYYSGTWAGAMCPTDDVIAHLMLMRGDERLFWARANQHHPMRPEAGL